MRNRTKLFFNNKRNLLFILTLTLISFYIHSAETEKEQALENEPVSFSEEIITEEISEEDTQALLSAEIINAETSTENTQPALQEKTDNAETSTENTQTALQTETDNSETSDKKASSTTPPAPEYIELPYEGMNRPEVEKFRQMYLSEKWASLLNTYLEQALAYRLYVRKSINDRNMPEILEYLPVVESNYKTSAKSRSGAIGMWQFMENSVKPFLTLNDYVDERLDPWKSTDAALSKLNDNYRQFNDWLIAIAAYNCGAGAMAKALKKAQNKNFWTLVDNNLIPSQTANYIPKLLAIADLAINSEYYGINLPNHNEEFDMLYNERNAVFDYVTVSKAYSISQLAREMRIDQQTLKELNPSFYKGFTHPSKKSEIRLPTGMAQSAKEALTRIQPMEFPFKYIVVQGDSLWSISRRFGVSIESICELNGISENGILRIGKTIYIPNK